MQIVNRRVLSSVLFLLVLVSGANAAEEAKKDTDKLQGTWGAESYVEKGQGEGEKVDPKESPVRWVFKGDKVTFLADVEGASIEGTVKLDATKKPKTIDIAFPPAPGTKKGQTVLGIYEMNGDTFKICYGADGVKRPTEFKSPAGSKHMLIVFKQLEK